MATHANLSPFVADILQQRPHTYKIKLPEILAEIGMSYTELSVLTGIHSSTLGHLVKQTRATVNLDHMATIMIALGLTDLSQLIEIRFKHESEMKKEHAQLLNEGISPSLNQKMIQNHKALGWNIKRFKDAEHLLDVSSDKGSES